MIDGKLIDRKTNNINVRICLRENEFANYIEGAGWNKKRLNNWASNNVFRADFELTTKERKELAELYEKTKPEWECIRDPGQQIEHYQDRICEKKAKRFQSVFKTNTLQVKGENVMRITELLRKSSIALQVDMQSKEETIDYLVDLKQKTH